MLKNEIIRIKTALIIPFYILSLMWIIHGIQYLFALDFGQYGVYPRHFDGLIGVFFGPFIHGDWSHLMANSIPFFVLSASLFYFYKKIRYRVFIGIWISSELLLWIGGRSSYHIGVSGVIYGLAAFIILSGILRREKASMVIAILVAFLYGGMIWGVFPWFTQRNVSWDGHLYGLLSGVLFAYSFRKKDRQKPIHHWDETESEEDDENAYWNVPLPESETRKRKLKLNGETAILMFLFLFFILFLFLFRVGKDFL